MPPGSWPSICYLSGIMALEFDIFSLGPMIGECPSCLPTTLENLKTLTLTSVNACVEDDVRFMFCLIRSSPGLQDLTVLFNNLKTTEMPEPDHTGEAATQRLLETEEREHWKLSNLLTVILKTLKGCAMKCCLPKLCYLGAHI